MTRLVLIRHGEAQSYVDGVIGGHNGCSGLSDLGRRQAEALRDRLERTGELADATRLYASALPRAIQTAEILAPALQASEVESRCELCELHFGEEIDGLAWDEARTRYPAISGETDAFLPWSPNTETWAQFVVRAGTELRRLVTEHDGETIVVACHGGIVDTSFRALGGVAIQHRLNTEMVNTSITEWVTSERDGGAWRLFRYNDFAHLEGIPHS
jgi:probable phosphoglycerate mutase